MPHSTRGWITYTPSQAGWANMSIKSDPITATNNGQTLAIVPPQNNFWPMHHSDLRCVYGKDANNVRDSCIATDPTGTLFKIGATFIDIFGNSYTVYGLRNERYRTRDLK
jgi:hypothetical protein